MGKLLRLRPEKPFPRGLLPSCNRCGDEIARSDWPRSFQRGVRLTQTSTLTVREFLCPACFEQLAPEERDEWVRRQELAQT